MDASPILGEVLKAMNHHRLEAVMIGNAAGALHGAPVTTMDIDFMFRETPLNLRKLKAVAKSLGGVIMRPYYPVSKLYRVCNDDKGIQIDFLSVIHGIRSFEGIKARSEEVTVCGERLRLASLADIIKSKRTAGRARDLAVLPVLEETLKLQKEIRNPDESQR
jgi:predicted nucleotidyltransferase